LGCGDLQKFAAGAIRRGAVQKVEVTQKAAGWRALLANDEISQSLKVLGLYIYTSSCHPASSQLKT
jgi:hypothetical protein